MKKILVILAIIAMFVSCNNVSGDKNTTETEVDSTITVDTTSITMDSLRVDTLVIE